jgi:hypothetical protein
MTFRKTADALKTFLKKVTHEVPTGPHTDVIRRKINPSFKKHLEQKRPGVGKAKRRPRRGSPL